MAQPTDKTQKMAAVAEAVADLVLKRGMGAITVTSVARKAGVSRAWLYKYIGKTKEVIVEFFVRHFAEVFVSVDAVTDGNDLESWIVNRLHGSREFFEQVVKYPWFLPLYLRHRHLKDPLGMLIAEAEKKYFASYTQRLQRISGLPEARARLATETFLAFRLGLVEQWQSPEFRAKTQLDDLIRSLELYLRAVLRPAG